MPFEPKRGRVIAEDWLSTRGGELDRRAADMLATAYRIGNPMLVAMVVDNVKPISGNTTMRRMISIARSRGDASTADTLTRKNTE